jgi:hypothetical protein
VSIPPAVARFRERFRSVAGADRADAHAAAPTASDRVAECLELHGLALWMDIERAMRDLGASRPEDVLDEVNRRRLAASPMPPSLREHAERLAR